MANWCENKLVILGDVNEVKKFIQKGMSDGSNWGFEEYYPTPYSLTDGDDWYFWRAENWGTKWNPDDVCFSDNTIEFLTAYTPPVQWVLKVSKDYPKLIFKLTFIGEEDKFAGICEVQSGEFINYEEGDLCYVNDDGEIYSEEDITGDREDYYVINPFE